MRPETIAVRSGFEADPTATGGGPTAQGRRASPKPQLTIALVNNMPDAALPATERQFSSLLTEAAAGDIEVTLRLYALAEVPRGDPARATRKETYGGIDALRVAGADALIVTDAEAGAADLRDEPYWPELAGLVDWARGAVRSALFSCEAAHAAVLHLDGIGRRRLNAAATGIFASEKVADSPLIRGIADPVLTPHSRHDDLSAAELIGRGYQVLTRSAEVGVDMFLRPGESLFVFLQGHPEYDADSLMRQYRRDLGRFLRGEQAANPARPQAYFDPGVEHALHALSLVARRGRVTEVLKSFDEITSGFRPVPVWRRRAVKLFRNWLEMLATAKSGEAPDASTAASA